MGTELYPEETNEMGREGITFTPLSVFSLVDPVGAAGEFRNLDLNVGNVALCL